MTSRKDGLLLVKIDNGYDVAINGNIEKRYEIKCKEFGSSCELIALDLEQLLTQAMFSMADGMKSTNRDNSNSVLDDDFFKVDIPSDERIEEGAMSLEMMVRANSKVKISQIVEQFTEFVKAGLLTCECEIKMNLLIWNSIKTNDKLKIIFWYCSFFVNPLQRLSAMNIETGKKSLQGLTNGSETL